MIDGFFTPIAHLMKTNQKRPRLSKKLIADFTTGDADNWHFIVGDWAKKPLAIHHTIVTKDKIKTKKWRQGSNFNFEPWSSFSTKKTHYPTIIQITESTPAGIIKTPDEYQYDSGHIKYKIYAQIRDNYTQIDEREATQAEFVYLLYSGLISNNGNEIHFMETVECQINLDLIIQKQKTEKSMNSSEFAQASLLTDH